jgi:flagellar biogenesis protein FliO
MKAIIAGLGWLILPLVAAAQQPSPRYTPLTDEPHRFPATAAAEARPIKQFPAQPPANLRLASVAEELQPQTAKAPLRLAPRSEGSRSNAGPRKPAATSPGNVLGTVAGSLGVVLGLFLLIVWCSRRFSASGAAALPKEAIELLGRSPLTARQQMQLLRVGNKLLLVAVSPIGAETLTEISDATEVEHLLALCRRDQPGSSTAAFRQALAQLGNEPAERTFVSATRPQPRGGR